MFSKPLNLYIIGFALALLVAALLPYTVPMVILIMIIILSYMYREEFILIASILSYTVFTRSELGGLRDIIILGSTLLLVFIFFRNNGFKFGEYPKLPKEIIYFLLLLTVTIFISTISSSSIAKSFNASFRLIIFLVICFILYSFIKERKTIYLYIIALFLAELIIGLSIYYDFVKAGFSFFLSSGILARFTGVYDNPNFVGLTTLITTCLIITLFFTDLFIIRKRKIFLSLLLLNNAGILLITDSRAAIIAVIISSFFILFMLNKKLLLKLMLGSAVVIVILLFIPVIQDFVIILLRPTEFSSREYLWNSGIEMFKDNFLSGVGPEMFPKYFYNYLSSSALFLFEETGALSFGKIPSPHNFFLLMASENGVLGLVTAVSIFVLFFYLAFNTLKLTKDSDKEFYILSIAILGIGIGTFIRSFFEISGIMYYGYISRDLPFWIIFIILIYIYQKVKTKKQLKENTI